MDPRIQIVIAFMKDNLHREVLVIELARIVNLSPSRLRHLFKTETRVAPLQYFRTLKMKQAQEYLSHTWLSVTEIAMKLGWQDRSHFEREFKRFYSVTPVRMRKAHIPPIRNS